MSSSSRLGMVVVCALLAVTTACGRPGSDAAPPQQPVVSPSAQEPVTVEHATKTSASEQFCTRFGLDMSALGDEDEGAESNAGGDQADRQAALTDLETLLSSAPAEFRTWAAAVNAWVRAQLDNDTAALEPATGPAEEASYQIASRCQTLHVD